MTKIAKRLIIQGRVQGVGFRAWTVDTARAIGLCGWVRNRRDGDVEALIQGDSVQIDQLTAQVWQGPSVARVDNIIITDDGPGDFSGFEKRATF